MKRNINLIVWHCSDSDNKLHDNVATITKWHIERGFATIGYHFLITKDGRVHKGRDLDAIGAHAKGHNSHSIGICLTGKDKFSKEQKTALKELTEQILESYNLDWSNVKLHNELDVNKTCPDFNREGILNH